MLHIFVSLACSVPHLSPTLSCAPAAFYNNTCLPNPHHHLRPYLSNSSPSACCALCAANASCKSWSLWDEEKHFCALFDSVSTKVDTRSDCVSGAIHAPPPPAPKVLPYPDRTPPGKPCTDCPNIIWALTDDQDVTLGGWDPMRQTRKIIQSKGATLNQWRIHTPICSPSRSELVSGRYFHNIKSNVAVPPAKVLGAATAHVNGSLYINQSFGVYLRERKGYQVGLFGKANFNTYQGFDRWFEAAFLGYGGTWQDDESPNGVYHANKTEYATSLLSNKTVEWLYRDNITGKAANGRPFFVYFAPHCPHTPATPAHWYQDECKGVKAPRQPNYNWSTPLFHAQVSGQPPFTDVDATLIDQLARSRCQCLLSVDDAYAAIHQATVRLGVAKKTYWFISSDHGYNLGGHRLPSNKMLLYEHSLRMPMVVYGPGVPPDVTLPILGTNVDLAPTWLALAGIDTPECMDGRSVLSYLIPNASHPALMPATRAHLNSITTRGETSDPRNFRTEQFFQYYSAGPWFPRNGGDDCPICTGLPGRPHGTLREICDPSNTYIGLHVTGALGHYKYGEYQTHCSSQQMHTRTCFNNITTYELFDLESDPWELHNVAGTVAPALLAELRTRIRKFYGCQGSNCP